MSGSKPKRPAKPTVFLSHCSTNRRELLALKRFLDERAGGLIEFFLSSDDDSIAHGTIWPAEVRAALDRMALMLIFISPEALKSGWTYFEAGYGLHKLGTAKIYCLLGSDKATLPSPFDILQNRNLHSSRDVGLLVSQINAELDAGMAETVTKEEFDRLFKRPALGIVESGPSFEQLVESVTVIALGPPDGIEGFSRVCRSSGSPVSTVADDHVQAKEERYSTGVRIAVDIPGTEELQEEFEITDGMRDSGEAEVEIWGDRWSSPDAWSSGEIRPLKEIQKYNAKIREQNKAIRRENAKRLAEPRACVFLLSPINFSVPVGLVDQWLDEVGIKCHLVAEIRLHPEIACEAKVEAVSAKIHGSQFVLRDDGTLLWSECVIVALPVRANRNVTLTACERDTNLSRLIPKNRESSGIAVERRATRCRNQSRLRPAEASKCGVRIWNANGPTAQLGDLRMRISEVGMGN